MCVCIHVYVCICYSYNNNKKISSSFSSISQFGSAGKSLLRTCLEIRHSNYVCSLGMGIDTPVVRLLWESPNLHSKTGVLGIWDCSLKQNSFLKTCFSK